MELREYQKNAVNYTLPEIFNNKRPMLQLPTGSGKSIIAFSVLELYSSLMMAKNEQVYNGWITHRQELIDQMMLIANEKFNMRTVRLEAGIDSMSIPYYLYFISSARRKPYDNPKKGLLIVDEAHHAVATSWEKKIKNWNGPVLGLTATPWRLKKGEGFDHLFDSLYVGPQPMELVQQGHLAKVEVIRPSIRVYKNNLRMLAGDYSSESIESEVSRILAGGRALQEWRQHANGTQTMWCVPTKRAADMLKRYLVSNKEAAEVITSDTPKEERTRIITSFGSNKLRHIIQVDVLSEGVDFPDVQTICSLRPTKSKVTYLQQTGRGTRPKNPKNTATLIDYADNATTFGHPQQNRQWSLKAVPIVRGAAIVGKCYKCNTKIHPKVNFCPICDAQINFRCVSRIKVSYMEDTSGIGCGRKRYYKQFRVLKDSLCHSCMIINPLNAWHHDDFRLIYNHDTRYNLFIDSKELVYNNEVIHKIDIIDINNLLVLEDFITEHKKKIQVEILEKQKARWVVQQEERKRKEKEARLVNFESITPKQIEPKKHNIKVSRVHVTKSRQGNPMIVWTFTSPAYNMFREYSTWHDPYRKLIAIKLVEMLDIKVDKKGNFDPTDAIGTILKNIPITERVYNGRRQVGINWEVLINWEHFQIDN